jgi:hypothetical protein
MITIRNCIRNPDMSETAAGVKEVVAYFMSEEALQGAIDELLVSGFNRADLSLLASEEAVTEKLGHKYNKVTELEDDPVVPTVAYVSTESRGDAEGAVVGALAYVGAGILMGPVAAVGGGIAAIAVAAAAGGAVGGGLGAALAAAIGSQHAEYIGKQLKHGGILLWVRAWDSERERRAVEILKSHSGQDAHVHAIQTP